MENREVLEVLKDFGRVYIVGSFAIYKALCIDSLLKITILILW